MIDEQKAACRSAAEKLLLRVLTAAAACGTICESDFIMLLEFFYFFIFLISRNMD